jgi:hypothetical protein
LVFFALASFVSEEPDQIVGEMVGLRKSLCFHFPPDEIECVTEDDDNQPQKVPSEHEDHLN